jgi:Integrase core domain
LSIPLPSNPANQCRKPDPEIVSHLALRPPARPNQANRFLLEFPGKPSLLRHGAPLASLAPLHFSAASPDRGCQYCSADYQAELNKHGIRISMSGKGNCYDNAMVETFFKTLKSELVWRTVFYSRSEAEQAIARYIDGFYNHVRRHSALDFLSPAQFERLAAN